MHQLKKIIDELSAKNEDLNAHVERLQQENTILKDKITSYQLHGYNAMPSRD